MEQHTDAGRLGMASRAALLASIVVSVIALAACNTTEGAGKDLKSLGAGIEEAADDAKD